MRLRIMRDDPSKTGTFACTASAIPKIILRGSNTILRVLRCYNGITMNNVEQRVTLAVARLLHGMHARHETPCTAQRSGSAPRSAVESTIHWRNAHLLPETFNVWLECAPRA